MIRIIPALDIMDGKVVRLTQGDFTTRKTYSDNPLEIAKIYESGGIKYLHLVDLDGAKAKKIINIHTLEDIASQTNLSIDYGGGIQSDADIKQAFEAGASKITAGSVAVNHPDKVLQWAEKYGLHNIILGADVSGKKIAIHAWETVLSLDIEDFILSYYAKGFRQSICTDISKDGLLEGPSYDLYASLMKVFPELKLTASGGVSVIDDVKKLNSMNLDSVIIGKALLENKISLKELEAYLC